MRSPLLTLVLVVLGWPASVLVILGGYSLVSGWIAEEYPSPPSPEPAPPLIRHHGYEIVTDAALQSYQALPELERLALRHHLQLALTPVQAWLTRLDRAGFEALCIGENHAEATRRYLGQELLPGLRYDRLLLEVAPDELVHIQDRMAAGREYFPLLGADIAPILRDAAARQPAVEAVGIDLSESQRGSELPRDHFLAENFETAFRVGERHVLLFGAFHCSNQAGWLYYRLQRRSPPISPMVALRVVEAQAEGPVEAFVRFLEALDLPADGFVIAEPENLPERLLTWFALLRQTTLSRFDAVLIFRDRSASLLGELQAPK